MSATSPALSDLHVTAGFRSTTFQAPGGSLAGPGRRRRARHCRCSSRRSFSSQPPQIPNSWWVVRAYTRQGCRIGQLAQTVLACWISLACRFRPWPYCGVSVISTVFAPKLLPEMRKLDSAPIWPLYPWPVNQIPVPLKESPAAEELLVIV